MAGVSKGSRDSPSTQSLGSRRLDLTDDEDATGVAGDDNDDNDDEEQATYLVPCATLVRLRSCLLLPVVHCTIPRAPLQYYVIALCCACCLLLCSSPYPRRTETSPPNPFTAAFEEG